MIENPQPMKPYLVARDSDGAAEVCALTRGVWNIIDTGKFFAYEFDVVVEGEAYKCVECDDWTIYEVNGYCPSCANPIEWIA